MATERHRIAIIGLGQIGASIGMDMRGSFKGVDIIGHDKDPETAGLARRRGAVDEVAYTLPGAVEDASIVVVAVPVTAVREVFTVISPNLSDGAIVTDTASTKMTVLQWAEEILPTTVDFVGGHPMAGVETPGVEGAQSGMFQGATWAVIPLPRSKPKSIDTIVNLIKTLGGEPYFADSVEHDSLVAAISHLPIALSINLMRTAVSSPSWREMARMAAGSFRDVSRLASGSVEMHHSIFATNKDFILHWIDTYVGQLQEMRKLVDEGGDALQEALQEAYNARDAWLRGRVGETEQDRLYDEVPTASESAIGVFGGERLARIAGRFRRGRR